MVSGLQAAARTLLHPNSTLPPRQGICRHLVSVSLSKMTPLDGLCWCVSDTLSVSSFLNARLDYHIPKFPVEEVTNRNIRIKPTIAHGNV